jgi:hypothetical protein
MKVGEVQDGEGHGPVRVGPLSFVVVGSVFSAPERRWLDDLKHHHYARPPLGASIAIDFVPAST